MSPGEILQLVIGTIQGLTVSAVAVLVIFIGFCVLVGFTKTKRTAGNARVVKSLDESVSRQPVDASAASIGAASGASMAAVAPLSGS